MIRWQTPLAHMRRTVTRDTEYGGAEFHEGDKVVLYYGSANRDEAVFDEPDEIRLDRSPNPHLSFGIGPHLCLGAHVARMQMSAVSLSRTSPTMMTSGS